MFETERLIIRNFDVTDYNNCFESWGKDSGLGKYIIIYPMNDIAQMELLENS